MGAGTETNILESFKAKISECITMVGIMGARDRITVSHFNLSSLLYPFYYLRLLSSGIMFLKSYNRLLIIQWRK